MEIRKITHQVSPTNYNRLDRNNEFVPKNISEDNEFKYSKNDEHEDMENKLIKSIESANDELVVYDRKFEFSIHEKTKEIMVKVIDTSTGEVIREIPPEKILDLVASLWEIAGLIVDEKV